ncbi:MAG: hypothetical protein IPM55_18020 [Acidobacteria bacterium]|nr:hypothetical protein [Acidobacteriota bacterium]
MGSHSLKYGMEFRSYRATDLFFGNNQTGQFGFGANWTRGPLDNSAIPSDFGFSFASFLLGLPTSGSISIPADYAEQSFDNRNFYSGRLEIQLPIDSQSGTQV